ncbi:hypothetical protein [Paraburkholderia sp. UCT31]|nr:hypothetical protein [Paraburkholderia sp. UCT31]
MMLTPFGAASRAARIHKNLLLGQMATALGLTAAQLTAGAQA